MKPQNQKTQNQLVFHHLKSGKKLTSLQALNLYGCLRLSGRILELREQGHPIKSEMVKVNKKYVAQYSL